MASANKFAHRCVGSSNLSSPPSRFIFLNALRSIVLPFFFRSLARSLFLDRKQGLLSLPREARHNELWCILLALGTCDEPFLGRSNLDANWTSAAHVVRPNQRACGKLQHDMLAAHVSEHWPSTFLQSSETRRDFKWRRRCSQRFHQT